VAAVPVASSTSSVRFPCGVVTLGGRYRIVLSPDPHTKVTDGQAVAFVLGAHFGYQFLDVVSLPLQDEAAQELDVRWPAARLALEPQHAQTYPEVPVKASLEFPPTTCSAAAGAVIPELWLELLYCGHSLIGCVDSNATTTQVHLVVIAQL